MDLATGRQGKPHITSQQDRQKHQGIFGDGAYILNTGSMLEPEVQSSNKIHIKDGALMFQGALFTVKVGTYDEVTINNGNQGMKRKDRIVARYTYNSSDNIETGEWAVIQGTPAADNPVVPEATSGDIQAGDSVVECPVFVVNLDGINVTGVDVIPEMAKDMSTLNAYLAELQSITTETEYQITPSGGPTIRNQRITKQNNTVDVTAGFITTGSGAANTQYNIGTIPEDIRPDGNLVFIAPVTDGGWTNKGYAIIIIKADGQITYQINFAFSKDVYLWLNACYKIL